MLFARLYPFRLLFPALLLAVLTGCASLPEYDPPRIGVAGIAPLDSQGGELRFNVKLRIQNPNRVEINYKGVVVDLYVEGKRVATGLSDVPGKVPAYGELVYDLPVTVSTLNALGQAFALMQKPPQNGIGYDVRGRLDSGLFGTVRFSDNGRLTLPR
jgi:LEA14-like dessication related protein